MNFTDPNYPYTATIEGEYQEEMFPWIEQCFGEESNKWYWEWDVSGVDMFGHSEQYLIRLFFKNEKDQAWFQLRWAE